MHQRSVTLKDGNKATLTRQPMLPGDEGVKRTLMDMESFVRADVKHPAIIERARKLKKDTPEKTAYSVFKWVVDNYKYHPDGKDEHLTSPWITVTKNSPYKAFDCDDMSMLLSALLEANGIKTAFKAIAWRATTPPKAYTHVYIIAKMPQGWMPMDAVMGRDGFGNERPFAYRALLHPVNLGTHLDTLDDRPPSVRDIDMDELATEMATRAFAGEPMRSIIEDVGRRICIQGIKEELYNNRTMLIAGGAGIAVAFLGGGFALGRALTKKKARKS